MADTVECGACAQQIETLPCPGCGWVGAVTGVGAAIEEGDNVAPVSPAAAFFGAAEAFVAGARALVGPGLGIPLAFLSGQALECLLKAYLAQHGVSQEDLRKRPFGHDLTALWVEANQRGLTMAAVPMPNWAQRLSELHAQPYQLRYPMGLNGLVCPAAYPMIQELQQILGTVRQEIR